MNKKSGTEIHACEIILFQYDQCLLKIYDLADINIIIIIVCYPPYWRKGLCGFINSFSWFSEIRWFTPHSNPDLDFFCVRFHYLSLSLKLLKGSWHLPLAIVTQLLNASPMAGTVIACIMWCHRRQCYCQLEKHTSAVVRHLTYLGPSTIEHPPSPLHSSVLTVMKFNFRSL